MKKAQIFQRVAVKNTNFVQGPEKNWEFHQRVAVKMQILLESNNNKNKWILSESQKKHNSLQSPTNFHCSILLLVCFSIAEKTILSLKITLFKTTMRIIVADTQYPNQIHATWTQINQLKITLSVHNRDCNEWLQCTLLRNYLNIFRFILFRRYSLVL